jgi:ABC-type antimicrobial peptide transport system permease subunit
MTFALIGRSNHNEGFDILSTLGTALPFVLSWALLSPLLGAYTGAATKAKSAILSGILPAWAISVPTGIAIRGALKGYVPPTPFIIVTLVSTLVLLYGSRYVYLSLVGSTNEEERDAGAFEIFKMIGTLVKRW